MNTLLVVLPYHQGDYKAAKFLLEYIAEIGGCKPHSCLLVADAAVDKEDRAALTAIANRSFQSASTITVVSKPVGYPPNHMFTSAARHIYQTCKTAWLWLEPDCVPLRPGWLDALAAEYDLSPKKFMGCLVEATQPGIPPVHLPGCSIYPPDAFPVYDAIASIKTEIVAWDMEAAKTVVPRSRHTPLIQHFWGKRSLPPTFVELKKPEFSYPEGTLDLTFIKRDAVLFHRCKDGTLLRLLQELRRKHKEMPAAPKAAPKATTPPKPVEPTIA